MSQEYVESPESIMRGRAFVGVLVLAAIVGVIASLAAWCFLELLFCVSVGDKVRPIGEGTGTMRPGRTMLVVIAAMCATLAVAPQTAIAGKEKKAYEGAVATQGVGGQTPTIQLKVQFRRKGGKLVPDYVANLKHRAIALFCPDGTTTFVGPFNAESGAVGGFAQPGFIPYPGAVGFKPFKKGRYSLTLTGDEADSNGTADLLQLITRVSSKGAATGTIRLVAGSCDSGTVSYTAPRVASFSPAP